MLIDNKASSITSSPLEYETTNLYHLSANIISTSLISPTGFHKSYIEYTIRIFSVYKIWHIQKRYSDFESLHDKLKEKIPDLTLFPPKRFFNNTTATVEERKELFNIYLSFLFNQCDIFQYEDIIRFIEIDQIILELLIQKQNMTGSSSYSSSYYTSLLTKCCISKSNTCDSDANNNFSHKLREKEEEVKEIEDDPSQQNYFCTYLEYKMNTIDNDERYKSCNMIVIEEFLRNLNEKYDNKTEILRTFEGYIRRGNYDFITLNKQEIVQLYTAKYNQRNNDEQDLIEYSAIINDPLYNYTKDSDQSFQGLLNHIGRIEENTIGAEACLGYLGKLLDYEYNPDSELYISSLRETDINYIKMMRLDQHILSNKANFVNISISVLFTLFEESLSYDSLIISESLNNNKEAIIMFEDWLENRLNS